MPQPQPEDGKAGRVHNESPLVHKEAPPQPGPQNRTPLNRIIRRIERNHTLEVNRADLLVERGQQRTNLKEFKSR